MMTEVQYLTENKSSLKALISTNNTGPSAWPRTKLIKSKIDKLLVKA